MNDTKTRMKLFLASIVILVLLAYFVYFALNTKYRCLEIIFKTHQLPSQCQTKWKPTSTSKFPLIQVNCSALLEGRPNVERRYADDVYLDLFRAANGCRLMDIYDPDPFNTLTAVDDNTDAESCKPRVLIISHSGSGDRTEFCDKTFARFQEYADYHGYTFTGIHGEIFESAHYYWKKPFLLNQTINDPSVFENYDIIAWFDDDILLLNFDIELPNFFKLARPEAHLIVSRDIPSHDIYMPINAGIILMRVSEESKLLMADWLRIRTDFPYFKDFAFFDQAGLTLSIYRMFHQHTTVLPSCTLQCFHDIKLKSYRWHHNCMSIHPAGPKDPVELGQAFARYANRSYHLNSIEFANTSNEECFADYMNQSM